MKIYKFIIKSQSLVHYDNQSAANTDVTMGMSHLTPSPHQYILSKGFKDAGYRGPPFISSTSG